MRTPAEVESTVTALRPRLDHDDLFCGPQAIHWELEEMGIRPPVSTGTIERILRRQGMTKRRGRGYASTGKAYPALPAQQSNQSRQADLVGPRYLRGPVGFHSLNAVNLRTARCGLGPLPSRSGQSVVDALWALRKRRGIPWSLGRYDRKFFRKVMMASTEELLQASRIFEQKHNRRYRYRKLGGRTPQEALAQTKQALRFPNQEQAPRLPLEKPEAGCYHLVRFIRSDLRPNVFGGLFAVSPQVQHEYVAATIDVKEQRRKVFLDRTQVEEYAYKLR